ncbi:MAG: two-component sensor histidine kinase [Crocinitomicaceae bacterium]
MMYRLRNKIKGLYYFSFKFCLMLLYRFNFIQSQRIFKYILIVLLFGSSFAANCQLNIIENTRIVLPSVDNYRTVIDKKGITWICSEKGLTRFNFENSKRFQIADGLPTNDIWQLYSDDFDRIWLFHKGSGISYIKNDSVHVLKGSEKLRETFVVADLNDTIYFKSFGFFNQNEIGETYYCTKTGKFGKCSLKNDKKLVFSGVELSSRLDGGGNRLYSDRNRNWYVELPSFSYGNVTLNDSRTILFLRNPYEKDISIRTEETNKTQKISELVGTSVGKSIFFPNSKECILEVKGNLRFYSNIALSQRDIGIERVLKPFYDLYGMEFNFSKDSEGNIWITVHRGGVHFIPKSYVSLYALDQIGFTPNMVMERNIIYLRCFEDRLFVFSRNSLIQEVSLKTSGIKVLGSSKDLKDIKQNGNHIAWSNNEGITVYNVRSGITKSVDIGERVVSFDFIDSATIYTNTGHEYDLRTGRIKRQELVQGPIDYMVISDSAIFTYKSNKLLVRDRKKLSVVYTALHKNIINAEQISRKQVVFFIENNGIILFDNFGRKKGHFFKNSSIQKVFYYKDYFFAISDKNIYFSKVNAKGEISEKVQCYHTFLERINLSIQSATVHKNRLVLGLNNGIYNYQFSDILSKVSPMPSLYFNGVSINSISQSNQESTFLYSDKDFLFSFSAYSYGNFGDVTLNYRLTGFDDKWFSSKSQAILYKYLPPGDYTLSVYASSNGRKSSVVNYSFSIPAPFWQSTLFLVLCIVVFIAAMVKLVQIIFKYRSKVYERKNMLLELEFKALKAQLNPHFIFNSLNSLQTVMHRKSEIEANNYIVSFSRLMRTLLDNSRLLNISLADELEFLKNFVFLSTQKINDPISFSIDLGKNVVPDQIHIRNMILQPFIENSVLHGLANKEGEKCIRLELERSDQTLIVVIIDNGVGRKAAEKYNKRKEEKHNSVSTTILKEKSRLLKDMHLEELKFVTTDLYENGEPIGTKVVVRMKIFEPSK